jgi:hypothetical protein
MTDPLPKIRESHVTHVGLVDQEGRTLEVGVEGVDEVEVEVEVEEGDAAIEARQTVLWDIGAITLTEMGRIDLLTKIAHVSRIGLSVLSALLILNEIVG